MLSAAQLVIIAYLGDGAILCRACGESRRLPTGRALTVYELEEACDPESGEFCGACGVVLIEPEEPEAESTDIDGAADPEVPESSPIVVDMGAVDAPRWAEYNRRFNDLLMRGESS